MPEARNSFHLISRLSSVNFFVLLSVHFLIGISHAVTLKSSFLRMSTPLSRMAELGLNVKAFPEDNYEHILGFHDENYEPSKLQVICRKRMEDVNHSKEPLDVNGCGIDRSFYISEEDLARDIEDFDAEYGPPLNLMNRVKEVFPEMAIAAEFKRASPSKGDININVDIVKQCVEYAEAGAAVISVLTEFKHFKGTLADLKKVRLATQKHASSSSENKSRPAILRKDFILDSYQIYEARAAGADTVLLIVAVLGVQQLQHLIAVCRRLSMEPLVEVHTQQEMEIALDCGARVIGVNNRNLHTFQLNLETTAQAVAIAARRKLTWRPAGRDDPPPPLLIFALSGISSAEDVATFKDLGVACCLVGEALMKSEDPAAMMNSLLGLKKNGGEVEDGNSRRLVKVCGITRPQDAEIALQNGANFIGLIFAEKSPRKVASISEAQSVVQAVQKYGERTAPLSLETELSHLRADQLTSKAWFSRSAKLLEKITLRRPLVVGVFQDQDLAEVNRIAREAGLDLIQLHGRETVEYISKLELPCIKVVHIPAPVMTADALDVEATSLSLLQEKMEAFAGHAVAVILDTSVRGDASGGTGITFDWSLATKLDSSVILAGGLKSENVEDAARVEGVVGLDVSSGVEVAGSPGVKDPLLVEAFLKKARLVKTKT